jgi:UDP-glucuronate decarboxylase
MLEFAKYIKEMTGSKAEIVHKPIPLDDPTRRRPDITRARRELGWEPKVTVREGLEKTIAYFTKELAAPREKAGASRPGAGPYNKINLPGLN